MFGLHLVHAVLIVMQYPPQKRGYWHEAFGAAYAANWALVVVGIAAGYLTWKTLRAIKRQAEIQAVGLRQWLDISPEGGRCVATSVLGGIDYNGPLTIWFNVTNPTPYPLTITEVSLKVSRKRPDGPTWEPFSRKEKVVLPPKKENISEPGYRFSIVLDLDAQMREDYNRHEFHTSISGHAAFQPAMGKPERTNFGWLIRWGPPVFMEVMSLSSELTKLDTDEL